MGIVYKRGGYEVEIMGDSYVVVDKRISPQGYHRVTTIRGVFPRIVLAELNTHREFSRNSASSRAIPARKMRETVLSNPFIPDRFPLEHSGMQASDWIEADNQRYESLVDHWLDARNEVVRISAGLSELGISKQLSNRFLEPVLMHQVILSATQWENFFALRAHDAAQNEIRILAEMILEAMNESTPKELMPGEWHLPYGDRLDEDRLGKMATHTQSADELKRKITVARCARVSYLNFEGKDDYQADLKLYENLFSSGHWSPFEHVARAMTPEEYGQYSHTSPQGTEFGWCGNFRGFIQLRKLFPRQVENRPEPRLKPIDV